MKKFVAGLLTFCMMTGLVTACSGGDEDQKTEDGKTIINLWTFTDEVPGMVNKYLELHPEMAEKYDVQVTNIPTTDGAYQPALDTALVNGGAEAPDIYCAESAFVLKYTQGDMAEYACAYDDLGIDTAAAIDEAQIADYSVQIGTRPSDNKVVGLGYQATGGAYIYRRSLAIEAFGTDDPTEIASILGSGTQNWDKFFEAAEVLAENGIAIVSGDGDIWHAVENSSESGWIVDDTLTIDENRENFLDISMMLTENGYSNQTQDWTDAWFADMKGLGDKPCFGFFGPAWLINYTLGPNCGGTEAPADGDFTQGNTYGDWAVCPSPVGFFWGGTWLLANKDLSDAKKEFVADLFNWITLDCTENGLQYMWANGLMNENGTKDSVASATVMQISDGSIPFLAGQNMFDVFVPANAYANGSNLTQYDETINQIWRDQVRQYTSGEKSRDEALESFREQVGNSLGINV